MFNNDKINKNKEAAIIEVPDAVLNSNEENNPKIMKNIIAWFQNYKGNNLVEIEGVVSNIEAIGLIEFASKSFDKYGVRPR